LVLAGARPQAADGGHAAAGLTAAGPVQSQGPNFGTWSIGQIETPLSATGGDGTYAWSVVAGSLPLSNAPGNQYDWVALYCPATQPDGLHSNWKYMSDTQGRPQSV
jgi:hypothetical protein